MSIPFDYEKEFKLLSEYMDMYVQILPHSVMCGGNKIHRPQMPSFDYFKETYNDERYSLSIPHCKESKVFINGKITDTFTRGLGTVDGIGYRYFNYWMGCKFFTDGNLNGDWTINTSAVNEIIKSAK